MLAMRRTISMAVVVCMLSAIFPASALASGSHNINAASIVISQSGDYVITGTGTPTANFIRVMAGVNANITLNNVRIDANGTYTACAFRIEDNSTGNVNITLVGTNVLTSDAGYAGLQKNGGNTNAGTLTIGGTGSLTANGGPSGAGIGGGTVGGVASNITINGGTVVANGGEQGAGIGGGSNMWGGSGTGKNITINGGAVTANGGTYGAGIGGGNRGHANNIAIKGGTVTAAGGDNAAGIGGGDWGDGEGITLGGGIVTAAGGAHGAGIGGGWEGSGNDIAIGGGTVTAAGGINSPGIGGGEDGCSSNIRIRPAAGFRVRVRAGTNAAAAVEIPGSPFATDTLYTGTHPYFRAEATPTPPGVPAVTAASASYSSVRLAWGAVAGAGGYEVYRATSSGGTYTKLITTTSLNYTNTGLATGTTYYYKVRAYRTEGGVKVYGGYSAVKSAKPTLGAMTLSSAVSAGYNSVKLTWSTVAGAGGYEVYRATSTGGTYTKLITTTALNYTNTGLVTGRTYYFKVRAYRTVNGVKVYGGYSAVRSAKPALGTATLSSAASAGYSSVKLIWSAVAGAGGYEVYRAASAGGVYAKVMTTTSLSYTNTGLATGTTYYYKVRAYRTVGGVKVYGGYSAVKSAKPVLATPTSVKAARASASSVKVTWGAVTGAGGYEVYRATSSSGVYAMLITTAALNYTNTGLVTGRTYYYKVRAYRTVSGVKVYGGYSAVVPARPAS